MRTLSGNSATEGIRRRRPGAGSYGEQAEKKQHLSADYADWLTVRRVPARELRRELRGSWPQSRECCGFQCLPSRRPGKLLEEQPISHNSELIIHNSEKTLDIRPRLCQNIMRERTGSGNRHPTRARTARQ